MYAPFVQRLNDWLLTTDRKQRVRITRSLMAANVFLACVFLQIYACLTGFMDPTDVKRLSGAILVNIMLWYAVLRSGLNLRFKDPAFTLPQIMAAQTIIVGAYSVTGPIHGSTMMLLVLVLVFGVFNMKRKGSLIASIYTVVLAGIAMAIKSRTDPIHYPLSLEIAHFVLIAAIVPTISSLAAHLASLRAKLQSQKDELANALVRIQILATRDELTGLLNRRHMMEVLTQHRKRLERSGHHRFCLALLDIDHFKKINDTYGHGVGDEVLRNFSKIVQGALRDTDVLARWGGEEFLVLLNDTAPELANVGLERARAVLAETALVPSHPHLRPTFSAGLTSYFEAEPLDLCIERADRALYRAKHGGRNRTVIQPGPDLPHGVAVVASSAGLPASQASATPADSANAPPIAVDGHPVIHG